MNSGMKSIVIAAAVSLWAGAASGAEYFEKNQLQHDRAFSPAVMSDGGKIVWLGGMTATVDASNNDIRGNFELQAKRVFQLVDETLKRAGGSIANVVTMTVMIKEPRHAERFAEIRKEQFPGGDYPASMLITGVNFARIGVEVEIQAIGVLNDRCSNTNPCSAERLRKK